MFAEEIAPGVARLQTTIANAYLVGERGGAEWVLVDALTPGNAGKIQRAAEQRHGSGARPRAILLTHGHFDHAGSARDLADMWDVPVFAHALERPYLTGKTAYPPKDPTVGGAMAFLSRFFPSRTTNIGDRLRDLPDDEVPFLSGWRWYHTPGHAPGEIVLFEPGRAILLAGDTIATADLDSWIDIALQPPKISRPPAPFTFDWEQARQSVGLIAGLEPRTVGSGHGMPMSGAHVAEQLKALARNFPMPPRGRYAAQPARTNQNGIVSVPPPVHDPLPRNAALFGLGVAALSAVVWIGKRSQS